MAAATVGGTAARIGGGKFENGAKTFAFMRLFGEGADYYTQNVGREASLSPGENQPGHAKYDFDPATGQQYPDSFSSIRRLASSLVGVLKAMNVTVKSCRE